MNAIKIRDAEGKDMDAVHKLIIELARFEESESAVETSPGNLQQDGYNGSARFKCWVAENEDEIVGMALVYPRYSTWVGPVLHLEDLIVTESNRGLGIGGLLLDVVVKYGHSIGVKRISWEVLDWNEPAIKFYEERGARVMRDWDVVQLDEIGIKKYMERL
ncbi:MAG: GNAT family N-acetyltransferase [Bacteroidia bacterium]|nr:GNAT family N-acetyltransferase [Bacteroidia bacterium]